MQAIAIIILLLIIWKILEYLFSGLTSLGEALGRLLANTYYAAHNLIGGTGLFMLFTATTVLLIIWLIRRDNRLQAERIALKEQKEAERQQVEADRYAAEQHKNNQKEYLGQRSEDLCDQLANTLCALAEKHLATLQKKRSLAITKDDYGIVMGLDKWQSDLDYFIDKVILNDFDIKKLIQDKTLTTESLTLLDHPQMTEVERATLRENEFLNDIAFLKHLTNRYVEIATDSNELHFDPSELASMSGEMFEVFCQKTLENCGWSVVRKGGTGDQGVDLLAHRAGISVAIQCKRYSKPVGNKAVQEVEAGRQYEQAMRAAVVSNADFTPSAKQLASALGVLLIHYTELPGLDNLI